MTATKSKLAALDGHALEDGVQGKRGFTASVTLDGSRLVRDKRGPLGECSSVCDSYGFQIDNSLANFQLGQEDGDGNKIFSDGRIVFIAHADTTTGGFGNPTGNGHTGCARDGKFYFEGSECGPGVFGTLADGFNHLAWRNSEEEPFKVDKTAGSVSISSDDVAHFSLSMNGWVGGPCFASEKKWYISPGDFDMEVSFDNLSAGIDTEFVLVAAYNRDPEGSGSGAINRIYVGRTRGRYEFMRQSNGSWSGIASGGGDDASGKLRMTRVSGVYHAYYWSGGSWVEIGSGYSCPMGDDYVFVAVTVNASSNHTIAVDASSFEINSGTIVNTSGWSREAFGSDRGYRDDMPESALIAITEDGMTIIDEYTKKLWMRFEQDANNLLYSQGDSIPVHAEWNDGVLIVALASVSGDYGGGVVIDFTEDRARAYADPSNSPGKTYAGSDERASGAIALRNDGKSWSHAESAWAIQENAVRFSSIYRDGAYEYHALATSAGVSVFKKTRWNRMDLPSVERAQSSETGDMSRAMFRESDGELFYTDDTNIMSISKATLDAAMSGSFSASTSKPVPGDAFPYASNKFVLHGSHVYFPSRQGVYRADWPSGSFSLFISNTEHSSTHEIIHWGYDSVSAIAVSSDGAVPVMILAMVNRFFSKVAVVNMLTWEIYGYDKAKNHSTVSEVVV